MQILHEKLVTIKTGRSVKIIAHKVARSGQDTPAIEWNILIKEPQEANFHPLVSDSHPIYWKLKRMTPLQRQLMELQYAGIHKSDIGRIVRELGKMMYRKNAG